MIPLNGGHGNSMTERMRSAMLCWTPAKKCIISPTSCSMFSVCDRTFSCIQMVARAIREHQLSDGLFMLSSPMELVGDTTLWHSKDNYYSTVKQNASAFKLESFAIDGATKMLHDIAVRKQFVYKRAPHNPCRSFLICRLGLSLLTMIKCNICS